MTRERTGRIDTCALRLGPWIRSRSNLKDAGREKQDEAVDALLAASDAGAYRFVNEFLARLGVISWLCPSCFFRFEKRGGRAPTPAAETCRACWQYKIDKEMF